MTVHAEATPQDRTGPRDPAGYLSAMQIKEVQDRRRRLRRLDDCLNLLEQAHEHDLTTVTSQIVEMVEERVPQIYEGMVITDAIDEVLHQQEPYMVQMRSEIPARRVRRRREPFDIRMLLGRH